MIVSFLGALKEQSPGTTVNVIMTDDGDLQINYTYCILEHIIITADNTGWLAAKSVYGELKHLLCHWHVDR